MSASLNNGLIDQLIATFVAGNVEAAVLKTLQKSVSATLKESQSSTDQFAVRDRIAGIEERCRIKNNDELADAFRARVDAFYQQSEQWTYETLDFLLHLVDGSIESNGLERLERADRPESPVPLTWKEILGDEPLDNSDGLWDNVDFAAADSDFEEQSVSSLSVPSTPSSLRRKPQASSKETLPVDRFLAVVDFETPRSIDTSAMLLPSSEPFEASETFVVRECIFMLLGLSSNIFTVFDNGRVTSKSQLRVKNVSDIALHSTLESLAKVGSHLNVLRQEVKRPEKLPLLQRFQLALQDRLSEFRKLLSKFEARNLDPRNTATNTLLGLHAQVERTSRTLVPLVPVVTTSNLKRPISSYAVLECLYDLVCSSQATCDVEIYEFTAKVFFDCFNTYLKPITQWMESGSLSEGDEIFFIKQMPANIPLELMWTQKYYLVRDRGDNLWAPGFLHLSAEKIFRSGKSVDFLRQLGIQDLEHELRAEDAILSFENVCGKGPLTALQSFDEGFSNALEEWLASKQKHSSRRLKDELKQRCGLWSTLDLLQSIYLGRNGALSLEAATKLFRQIDRKRQRWADPILLTELFREVLEPEAGENSNRFSISILDQPLQQQANIDSVHCLERIQIQYTLPWPIANIVSTHAFETYRRVAVVLLQVQRAKLQLDVLKVLPLAQGEASTRQLYRSMLSLRHRLRWYVDTLQTYFAATSISQATATLHIELEEAEHIDEMFCAHYNFIKRLEDRFFITDGMNSLLQAMVSILDLAGMFARGSDNFQAQGLAASRKNISKSTEQAESSGDEEWFDAESAEKDGRGVNEEGFDSNSLEKLSETFDRLLNFVHAAVRKASRKGKEPCWEVLADNLESGLVGAWKMKRDALPS